jgi:hypothetical protein
MDLITLAVMPNRHSDKDHSGVAMATKKSTVQSAPLAPQMTRVLASFGACATDDAVRVLLRELHRLCVQMLLSNACVKGQKRVALAQLVGVLVAHSPLATRVDEIHKAMKEIQAARSTQSSRKEVVKDAVDDDDDDGDDVDAEMQAQLILMSTAATAATTVTVVDAAQSLPVSRRSRRLERRERLSRNLSPDDYVVFTECTATSFSTPRPRFSQWLRADAPAAVEISSSLASTSLDMNSVVGTGDAARRALLQSSDEEYNAALPAAQSAARANYEPLSDALKLAADLIDCIGALAVDWVEDVVDDVVAQRGGSGISAQTGKFTREVSVPEALLAAQRVWTVWQHNIVSVATSAATAVDTPKNKRKRP